MFDHLKPSYEFREMLRQQGEKDPYMLTKASLIAFAGTALAWYLYNKTPATNGTQNQPLPPSANS
ncbi:MAG: hypothetical protein DHS20C02_04760 [Micavibrio sp.]|nr:MAG: hypothetical protein DHS20C02_04760 [Micavibrio sp.]